MDGPVLIMSEPTILQRSTRQILAGGSAGLVEVCIMHPLDVIKTRFQIQRGPDDPTRYTSFTDCVRKMIRNEGFLSLYKGILPPILAEAPKRATKFFSFECYKSACALVNCTGPWSLVAAGLASGLTEGMLITPFERVKVHMQAQRNRVSETPNTWVVAREIVKRDGFGTRGLLKGVTATLARDGIWNAMYFGIYHNMKPLFVLPEKQNSIPIRLLLGFLAGSLSSLTNIPFDVAKSRIQGPQTSNKYRSTIATVHTVFKEEGFLALYKGLIPKVLRLGPGGAIMLVVYEQISHYLQTECNL